MSDLLRATGLVSGMDTDSIVQQLVQKYQDKVDKATKAQKAIEYKQKVWKDTNTKLYTFYTKSLSKMKLQSTYGKMKSESSNKALTVESNSNAIEGTSVVKIKSQAKAGYITGAKLPEIEKDGEKSAVQEKTLVSELGLSADTYQFNGVEIEIDDTTTVAGLADKLSKAGVKASFDEKQGRFYIGAKKTGVENDFDLSEDKTSKELLKAIGMKNIKEYVPGSDQLAADDEAVRIAAADAEIHVNGIRYVSDSNTFSINGMTMTVTGQTDEEITVTNQRDNSGVYDAIKSFFKEYNDIMNEMSKLYNAKKEKYEPLTDEEKSALNEEEQKKWEEKLNETALSKDEHLSRVMLSIRSVMNEGVEMADGSKMYLSHFGIKTLNYFKAQDNEKYAYHIDGNADDEDTMANKDALSKAIAENPDQVCEFFTKLADNLYKKLTKEMESTEYSSIYKVYNDKQLDKDYKNYNKIIKNLQKQMEDAEDRYYKQFSKMEVALSKINSKQASLSQYFGA